MPPAFDFPGSPSLGDVFTDPSGASYNWNGYAWMGGAANSLGALIVSDTPPSAPANNSLWFESDTGMLFLRYNDGNSSQWVQVNALPDGAGYATIPYVNSLTYGTNRLINGDMQWDQRNGGVSNTALAYTADRWALGGNVAGKFTYQRTSGPGAITNYFPFYLMITTTTAYTPLTADAFYLHQPVEANAVNDLAWGTASAQPVTLSFWISVSAPGLYSGSIRNYPVPSTRSYPFIFNVPNAVTWTKIVITIPGDTAGTWVNVGNAASFALVFDVGTGATYRTTAGSWQNGNYLGVNGAQSLVTLSGATFSITGIKLETGLIATPFQLESLQKRLADCLRYYQPVSTLIAGYQPGAGFIWGPVIFGTPMRTAPTAAILGAPGYGNCSALTFAQLSTTGCYASATVTAAGNATAAFNAVFNAEL